MSEQSSNVSREKGVISQILSEMGECHSDLISEQQLHLLREKNTTSGVAVWGTGKAGKYTVNFCRDHEIRLACVVDSFPHKQDDRFEGIPIYSASDFFIKFPHVFVIIACSYIHEIDCQLNSRGYQYITFDTGLVNYALTDVPSRQTFNNALPDIETVYSMLADDASKRTFVQILKYRLSLDRKFLDGLNLQKIYFDNDVIPSFEGDTFIDCGAYTGDTLLAFHKSKNCRCKTYYALEPTPNTFKKLQETIQSYHIDYAAAMNVASWDDKGTLRFVGSNNQSNHISSQGELEVCVDSLDHLFGDKKVDFIKMDIEGAEIPALMGAKNIIQSRSPILVVSIYHKKDDLWRIPLLINSFYGGYRFYIRHHSPWGDDTVLYAV